MVSMNFLVKRKFSLIVLFMGMLMIGNFGCGGSDGDGDDGNSSLLKPPAWIYGVWAEDTGNIFELMYFFDSNGVAASNKIDYEDGYIEHYQDYYKEYTLEYQGEDVDDNGNPVYGFSFTKGENQISWLFTMVSPVILNYAYFGGGELLDTATLYKIE